jgi:outer membrane protein assembly factor BamB
MTDVEENVPTRRRRVPIRMWVLVAILAVYLGLGAMIWLGDDQRQNQNVNTIMLTMLVSVLLLLWVVILSRLRWFVRVGIIGLAAMLGVAAAMTVRIEGVSGDLLPSLKWRWTVEPGEVLPEPMVYVSTAMSGLADYPQFLGPDRNGVVESGRLARDWSTAPPVERWRREVGAGWSAFAVAGTRAVTQEQRGDEEVVVCYHIANAAELWVHGDDQRYDNPVAGLGPRATPTIVGDRVYTLGSKGLLNCLDLGSGERIWSTDTLDDADADVADWGNSGSPLVIDDLVVVNPGGDAGRSLIAYHRETGERIWTSGADLGSYSSPAVAELVGVRQIVIVNAASVTGHDIKTGEVLWTYVWPGELPKVAQPVPLSEDRLFVSAGYGLGSVLLQLSHDESGFEVAEVWKSRRLKAKFTNVVHRDGYLYGLDDGIFTCIDVAAGRRQWKDGRYGHGQIILNDDLIVVQTEWGEVTLVEATPDELRELGTIAALDSKTWNNATLAGRYLLVRNDREAVCYELPVR